MTNGRFDCTARDLHSLIDLLVDGELPETARRELLMRLEREPDGWRTCALGFLEAQSWRQELRRDIGTAGAEPTPIPSIERASRFQKGRRWLLPAWQSVLALAATFTFAFGLGFALCRYNQLPLVAHNVELLTPERPKDSLPSGHATIDTEPAVDTAADNDSTLPPMRAIGLLTLSMEGGGKEFALPVVDGVDMDVKEWLDRQPAVIPSTIRQSLENMGHQVVEHRELINIELDDGRHVILPVAQVKVRFANRVYQ